VEAQCVESQKNCAKVYPLIAKGTCEEDTSSIATQQIGLAHTVSYAENAQELDKLLRLSAYRVVNVIKETAANGIDHILNRLNHAFDININMESPDSWLDPLRSRGTGGADTNSPPKCGAIRVVGGL
jgi:hypothetical protein